MRKLRLRKGKYFAEVIQLIKVKSRLLNQDSPMHRPLLTTTPVVLKSVAPEQQQHWGTY